MQQSSLYSRLKMSVTADIAAAVSECGNVGYGHVGVAWLHQLVCILPHMVGRLLLRQTHHLAS